MNPNRTVSLDTTSDGIRQEDKPTPRLALELTAVLNRLFQCCVVEYVICLSNAMTTRLYRSISPVVFEIVDKC
jgi:hypothetical protein